VRAHSLEVGALLCREGTLGCEGALVGVGVQAKEEVVRGKGPTIALGAFSKARAQVYTTSREAKA
jgi:hypothetical protein